MNTIQENAAQRYIQADVPPPDLRNVDWLAKPLPFKLYHNCEQIPLSHDTVTADTQPDTDRAQTQTPRDSASGLSTPYGLTRGQIGQMLLDIYGLTRVAHSVPTFHPMLKFLPQEEKCFLRFYPSLLRPVPSGGALFPCELYLLIGPGQDVPAGIYHYDVAHHALDILKQGDPSPLLQTALAHPADTPPTHTLLLSSFFWKDGFKYGDFGYRLQGLDIGTIISQNEIITHHAGLSTTIHYQFQDKVLNDLLDLDPLHESVYAVIEWRPKTVGIVQGSNPIPRADPTPATIEYPSLSDAGTGSEPHTIVRSAPALGSINASALATNEISSRPMTESIARWPLPEEVHRASLIETREAFRPLHSLAPIQPPRREESKTLPLTTDAPLDLWQARSKRRSAVGTFLPKPLTKQQLSQLLRTCMQGTTNDLDGHTDFLQHTLLYCVVHRVQEVPTGIYRYHHEKHALELVRAGIHPGEFYQTFRTPNLNLLYMSVCLFPVGNYTSGFQAYGDRWYRMQNMEAGIITQRLYLAAAALKLGCRASLGFEVPETNTFLGLSDANDDPQADQYMSLMQILIAPEYFAHQHYEQSLLI